MTSFKDDQAEVETKCAHGWDFSGVFMQEYSGQKGALESFH